MRTNTMSAVVFAGVLLALTGCSARTSSEHSHSSSAASGHSHSFPPASGAPVPAVAPTVTDPLAVTRFQQAPCLALNQDKLHQLNVGAAGQLSSRGQQLDCVWRDRDGPSKMFLTLTFNRGRGLADIFDHKSNFGYLRALPDIEGYPAVNAIPEDQRDHGFCSVAVGVANDTVLNVNVALAGGMGAGVISAAPDHSDPCPRAQTVATAVIQTVKAG